MFHVATCTCSSLANEVGAKAWIDGLWKGIVPAVDSKIDNYRRINKSGGGVYF